jgi:surfactin synthase thioesterase subunit
MRLFCFPYLAGGASAYSNWHEGISNDIEVCSVQLPGRTERSDEEPFNDLDSLIEKMAEVIDPLLDKPFAVYAHSMGAGIAYELLRYLRAKKNIVPEHFFIGAWVAPQLPSLFKNTDWLDVDNPAAIPDDKVLETMKKLDMPDDLLSDKEWVTQILPSVKADLLIGKRYEYKSEEPLASPITAFRGSKDAVFDKDQVEPWSHHTNQGFEYIVVEDGNHLFIHDQKDEIIQYINKKLH